MGERPLVLAKKASRESEGDDTPYLLSEGIGVAPGLRGGESKGGPVEMPPCALLT